LTDAIVPTQIARSAPTATQDTTSTTVLAFSALMGASLVQIVVPVLCVHKIIILRTTPALNALLTVWPAQTITGAQNATIHILWTVAIYAHPAPLTASNAQTVIYACNACQDYMWAVAVHASPVPTTVLLAQAVKTAQLASRASM